MASKEQEKEEQKEGKSLSALRVFLSALTGRQWLSLGLLSLANLCSCMTFSCIVPFFPTEAAAKGLSTTQVGLIIGAFQLVMFCASPVLGNFMDRIGTKRMFASGLVISGVSTMLYGALLFLPSPVSFFCAALGLRCFAALGNAAFRTSSLALIAQCFPGRVSSIVGLTQTAMSVAYVLGPTLGSSLYELGGFSLPFLVLGSLILLSAFASLLLFLLFPVPKEESTGKEENERKNGSGTAPALWPILCVPEVALTLPQVFALELSIFFYDAGLAQHVGQLVSRPSFLVGLLLSLSAFLSMSSAPLWGLLLDRPLVPHCARLLMLSGTAMCLLFPLLMGPCPLLSPPLALSVATLCASFVLQGLAITSVSTPSFKFCIDGAKRKGFSETDTSTCGSISGLLNGAIALGALVGVTGGAVGVQWIGFQWTATAASAIHIPLVYFILHHFS